MSNEWNATLYHQISAPQISWGKKVLSRVSLRGDERLLDAGCGTGRLTRDLLEALPKGHVVALDVSQNMRAIFRGAGSAPVFCTHQSLNSLFPKRSAALSAIRLKLIHY